MKSGVDANKKDASGKTAYDHAQEMKTMPKDPADRTEAEAGIDESIQILEVPRAQAHTHVRARTRPRCTRAHARTHARTHARAPTHKPV